MRLDDPRQHPRRLAQYVQRVRPPSRSRTRERYRPGSVTSIPFSEEAIGNPRLLHKKQPLAALAGQKLDR